MTRGHSFGSQLLQRGLRAFFALLVGALAMVNSPAALAQNGPTPPVTSTARVTVVSPASLVKINDLDFGKIAAQSTAGNVILNPNTNVCTTTGTIIHIGSCRAANFAGLGRRNFFVRFTVSSPTNLTGPGQAMVMDTMTLDTAPDLLYSPLGNGNGAGNQRWRIVSLTGIFNLQVGGTLHVNANQAPGQYSGTFTVTANYQ